MAARHQVQKLMRLADGICHYCKKKCNYESAKMYPTRDHIVPKGLGGPNSLDNYVLACSGCNHKRGTMLFYCKCRDCQEKIYDALYDPELLSRAFRGMLTHNKPLVKKVPGKFGPKGNWIVRIGHQRKHFHTFDDAIRFAVVDALAKDRDYSVG